MATAGVDWTAVLVAAVPATIAAIASVVTTVLAHHNRRTLRETARQLQTPSGDDLGAVVERTEHASHADVALTTQVLGEVRKQNGGGD